MVSSSTWRIVTRVDDCYELLQYKYVVLQNLSLLIWVVILEAISLPN
jgi:hypothetical protein